jgi:hypothetical protein
MTLSESKNTDGNKNDIGCIGGLAFSFATF